jgi:hypothetical protein
MNDWLDDLTSEQRADWDDFVEHFRRDAVQKLEESAYVASLVPRGEFDVKFALETGAAILMGKPMLAIIQPGAEMPGKLGLVADEIVEADVDTEEGRAKVTAALARLMQDDS